ncbi:putative MFS transporter [Aspergillus aculeatinus CBS 121060]|uniref:MFS transporter n=1 Tax=Aspergillus aculeatinus CBS 121060 TaxID=1448322 RepID=A0ACD1HPQ4_9EURO|nr:putative MFS transporter [Aspergillus aculeatinus CBS 121060]RAH75415.1 putative MFS transporter [Aspergillus aculeatinus CBS 121060]
MESDAAMSTSLPVLDEETNRKLLRKIDTREMRVMCTTYALQYYDKALLSQAAIFGLRKDLGLDDGLKYAWVSLIFYFGYIARLLSVCPIICFLWAVVVLTTPACTSYTGILINQSFLGLIESGVSLAFMLCTGMWYTHSEQVFRSSLWYSFSGGSNIISPLINYGLGHITGGALHPWQYMYLIGGLATLLWSIVLWFVFPGTPQVAKGFTEAEKILVLERVRSNNAGAENRQFKCIGSGAVTTFGSIIFNGMGFTTFQSLLLNMPIGALAFVCILGSGYIGRKVPDSRLYVVSGACVPVILGSCLIWRLPTSQRAARIIGFYLINFFSSAWVQCIVMGTSNVAGHTKKATMAAATFIGYSLGNIIGPLTFDAKDAPRYDPGFQATVICFAICCVLAQVFRALMYTQSKRRDAKYGAPSGEHGLDDLTDGENKSFRYPL